MIFDQVFEWRTIGSVLEVAILMDLGVATIFVVLGKLVGTIVR